METRWILTEQEDPEGNIEVWVALDDENVLDTRAYRIGDEWFYSGARDIPCQTPKWWALVIELPPASPKEMGWQPDGTEAIGDIRWCWDGERVFRGERDLDRWYECDKIVPCRVLMWQEVRSRQAPSAP